MQSSPWVPAQLEAWDRRVNGVVRLLSSGKMLANELQLRMEGAASWKGEESMPHAHVHNTQQRLLPVLMYLRKLGALKATPITHLDVELPATAEIVSLLSTVLPDVTSLRLDSLIPPPHNHVQALCDSRAFVNIRKLDVCVTAWDQIQHLSHLSQLTELNVRYNMWNIPELTPLASLLNLTTFGIEVLDDRARFQLDFLGPVVRGVPRLRHLRAAIILSRTVVSESGPASCDFLVGCSLQTLDLDVRVPQDAARTVHAHFRNLHLAPQGCKVNLTIHADALSRETSFESAATRCVNLSMPRLGMAQPSPPEPKERWGALNMSELGSHAPDALSLLHLRGYRSALSMLPDLSAARLTRLQISNARLSPADFTVLGGCTTLEHLFVSFTYQPDTAVPGTSSAGDLAVGMGQSGMESRVLGVHDLIRPRELQASLRLAAHGSHGMVTRSRKSLQGAGRRSSGSAAAAPPQLPLDCSSRVAPYVLRPLLQLRKLRSLELLEEPQPPVEPAPRLSAVGASTGGPAAPAAARTRRAAQTGAAGAAGSAAGTAPAQPAPSQAQNHAQTLLPLSRSGLNHFLMNVAMLSNVAAVHIRLLSEEADLPDCPCRVPCFSVATKGKEPLFDVDAEAVEAVFTAMEPNCYKIVLGSMVAQSPIWYRPSAWPSLEG
ncbi:hypothetical protein PLESTB_000272700 [Pleodorina starrii]|uniref:Uncharacterized protein n=1 Tax=Pleodorina starrii TaxID=330485 RepID=A0A9W6BCK7_9CHLO|nr:hypothetical protein PLESTB_000272700 [Pleodorina starrii]